MVVSLNEPRSCYLVHCVYNFGQLQNLSMESLGVECVTDQSATLEAANKIDVHAEIITSAGTSNFATFTYLISAGGKQSSNRILVVLHLLWCRLVKARHQFRLP